MRFCPVPAPACRSTRPHPWLFLLIPGDAMYAVIVHGVAGVDFTRATRFGVLPDAAPTITSASFVVTSVLLPWFNQLKPVSLGTVNGNTGPNVSHAVPLSRPMVNP